MKIKDKIILAVAKIKSKRLLTWLAIIISSLLFATILFSLIGLDSIEKSLTNFTKESNQDKYLVSANPVYPKNVREMSDFITIDKTEYIDEIKQVYKDYVAKQKELAAKKGIKFDESTIIYPLKRMTGIAIEAYVFDNSSPIYEIMLEKKQRQYVKKATNNLTGLKKLASQYNAQNYYDLNMLPLSFFNSSLILNNKENILEIGNQDKYNKINDTVPMDKQYTTDIQLNYYSIIDDKLVNNFILPETKDKKTNPEAIPVLVTVDEAVKLFGDQLGIPQKPTDNAQLLTWYQQLQQKINRHTYQVCYRNQSDMKIVKNLINASVKDLDTDGKIIKKTSDDIVYQASDKICDAVQIAEDNRSKTQKESDQLYIKNQQATGKYLKPNRQLLTFQIVGILPDDSKAQLGVSSVNSTINKMLKTIFKSGAIVPKKLYQKSRVKLINDYSSQSILKEAGFQYYIVEFNSITDAKNLIAKSCSYNQKAEDCKSGFVFEAYGKDYVLYQEVKDGIAKVLKHGIIIGVIISTIILIITMSRIIIDSRHETAIFRALGAKRSNILGIYWLYSILVAIRIILVSLALSYLALLVINFLYVQTLTTYAKISYGIYNSNLNFNLIGIGNHWTTIVILIILLISIISVFLPILSNSARNPIKDLRQKN